MKQCCLCGERKVSLFQPKRKNGDVRKRGEERRPTPGARKSKQRKKTGGKLKKKINVN